MISFKNKTVKWGIVIVSCIIGFGILHFVIGETANKRLENYKELLKQKQKKVGEIEVLMGQYPDPKKSTGEVKQKQRELEGKFISERELPRAMQMLTEKSSELNMEMSLKPVRELSFKELPPPQGITKIYLEMEIKAAYTALGDYLKAIEALPITFTVESFHLEREEDETGKYTGRILAIIIISSYSTGK